jgi:hypothetical protein
VVQHLRLVAVNLGEVLVHELLVIVADNGYVELFFKHIRYDTVKADEFLVEVGEITFNAGNVGQLLKMVTRRTSKLTIVCKWVLNKFSS